MKKDLNELLGTLHERRNSDLHSIELRDVGLTHLIDAIRSELNWDVALSGNAIFFETIDGDVCGVRGDRAYYLLHRNIASNAEIDVCRAFEMNVWLCWKGIAIARDGQEVVIRGIISQSESLESVLNNISNFIAISQQVKELMCQGI
ncbi:hypothetical protein [Burkholderia ubonensis]|uniref:hypothetical protein n=1 Tax=Burkholderia ubonensis TaxID=101571 RepID=UPI0012F8A3D1|nr:hypothetical protein [Burkholderia ubonensis]